MNPPDEKKKYLHILVGRPDEDCEVCRAHGLLGHELPPLDPEQMLISDIGPLDRILGCRCPLCVQLPFEPFEDPPADAS